MQKLVVKIKEGKDLVAMDFNGKSDPYVEFWVAQPKDAGAPVFQKPKKKAEIFKTKIMFETLFPVWNETFEILIPNASAVLNFEVTDYDRFSAHDPMGKAVVQLSGLRLKPHEEQEFWIPLQSVKRGEISVAFTLIPGGSVKPELELSSASNIHFKPTKITSKFTATKPLPTPPTTVQQPKKPEAVPVPVPVPDKTPSPQKVTSKKELPKLPASLLSKQQAKPNVSQPAESKPLSVPVNPAPSIPAPAKSTPVPLPVHTISRPEGKLFQQQGTSAIATPPPLTRSGSAKVLQAHDYFCDNEFPANTSSLHAPEDKQLAPGIKLVKKWLRPHELAPNPNLFIDGSDSGDAVQGAIGNCWLIGAFSILGTRQDLVDNIVVSVPDENNKGKYTFRLYKEGDWVDITIDDRLPCTEDKTLVFGRCQDINEIWVPLLEKANAKLFGTYQSLTAGETQDAIVDMTGGVAFPTLTIKPEMKNDEKLWQTLNSRLNSGSYFLSCSAKEEREQEMLKHGLLGGHAYSVLNCAEVNQQRLLQLRNPWGGFEWKGRWSDGSSEWTLTMRELLKFEAKDDGIFWMDFEDFCTHWDYLDCVHIFNDQNNQAEIGNKWNTKILHSKWDAKSAGGCFSKYPDTGSRNPQFILDIKKRGDVVVSVMQYDFRYQGDDKHDNFCIGMHVMKHPDGMMNPVDPTKARRLVYDQKYVVSSTSVWAKARESALELKDLEPGRYVIVPSTFEQNLHSRFFMRAFIKGNDAVFVQLPVQDENKFANVNVLGSWDEISAGGCHNSWKWINNTQYWLRLQYDNPVNPTPPPEGIKVPVTITLSQAERKPYFSVSHYLLKTKEPNVRLFDIVDNITPPSFVPNRTYASQVELKLGEDYVYIPCTFKEGDETNFSVTITYPNDVPVTVELDPIDDEFDMVGIQGEWKKETAGGCYNNPREWGKNPKFDFWLESEALVQFVLIQTSNAPIGLDVMDREGINFVTRTPFHAPKRANSVTQTMKAGHYLLVPNTFNPGIVQSFTLRIYVRKPVNFTLKPRK